MYRILITTLLLTVVTKVLGADGDIFTEKTVEGIEMTFKIISETDKTCQVGQVDGVWSADHAIPREYQGLITIPSYANGYHVIRIGRAAFDHCLMDSIIIPPDIETILSEAFNNCVNLTSITIPYNITKIGDLAFNYCSNLSHIKTEIEQPFVIANDVFRGIPSNTVLQVPRGTKGLYQSNYSWSKNFMSIEEFTISFSVNSINYFVASKMQKTVSLASGDYGLTLTVPVSITENSKEWKVIGIEPDVLNNDKLAAIIWNPEISFVGSAINPNILLYVKDKQYAPNNIKNVVSNGEADEIVLQDAKSNNNFYCPQTFNAKRVSYVHNYSMKTGYNSSQGWESIVLPFDVTRVQNASGEEIAPFEAWNQSSNRPFWLYSLSDNGWNAESRIKANTPYIISMPNNDEYDATYNLSGEIQFIGENVQIESSENLGYSKSGDKKFVPNYQNHDSCSDIYALNVNNLWSKNTDSSMAEGSAFIRDSRKVRPFEAYMTIDGGGTTRSINIFDDDDTTGIMVMPLASKNEDGAIRVYSLSGMLLKQGKDEKILDDLPKGIYVVKGKKIIK